MVAQPPRRTFHCGGKFRRVVVRPLPPIKEWRAFFCSGVANESAGWKVRDTNSRQSVNRAARMSKARTNEISIELKARLCRNDGARGCLVEGRSITRARALVGEFGTILSHPVAPEQRVRALVHLAGKVGILRRAGSTSPLCCRPVIRRAEKSD